MGKLLENLKKKRDESQSGKFFIVIPPRPLWKPPADGQKEFIRILPPTKEMQFYYCEYWAHFNLGVNRKEAHLCGRRFHNECPICEVVGELYEAGKKDVAKDYKAKQKFIVNLITKDEPTKVKIGMLGSSIEQTITAYCVGRDADEEEDDDVEVMKIEELGDVTDWKTGYWFLVKTREKGPDRTPNNFYKVLPAKKPSRISDDMETVKKILKQRADLQSLIESAVSPLESLEKAAEQLRRMTLRAAKAEGSSTKKKRRQVEEEVEYEEADGDDLPY
jgi:hypothetical protein